MVRIISALVLALSALIASPIAAQDFAAVPGLAALPAVEIGQDATAPVFVNDVNSPASTASNEAAVFNGFNAGIPEVREYVAPQLVAPQIDAFPQPVPQNAAAAETIASAVQPVVVLAAEPTVASDAGATAVQPVVAPVTEPIVAADASLTASQPVVVAAEPTAASDADPTPAQPAVATPTEPIVASDAEVAGVPTNIDDYFAFSASRPMMAAASGAPNEERSAVDEPRPVAAAALPAPSEERSGSAPDQPLSIPDAPATVAAATTSDAAAAPEAATPAEATTPAPTEAASKATNFKNENDDNSHADNTDHGARIATFCAVGVACALAIAGVAYARKRKMVYAKTPGTPKNELTFFHVQSRLTPPAV